MNYKSKNWLSKRYRDSNYSISKIAIECGANARTISKWIKTYGIIKLYNDAEWLDKQYNANNLSTVEIAKICTTTNSVVVRALKRLNIARRSISDGNKLKWKQNKDRYLEIFNSPEHRDKITSSITPKMRAENATRMRKLHKNPKYKRELSDKIKLWWLNPINYNKMMAKFSTESWKLKNAQARSAMPKISAIQETLYSILDDMGIEYFKERPDGGTDPECIIGPWVFDCVVKNGPTYLVIECQGDYFHTRKSQVVRDSQKASYLSSLPNYQLKCIWEHEFKERRRIVDLIKYWLGITEFETIDFDFDNISLQHCPARDYRLLLSKYHYLANAGRGGIAYGAYLQGNLAAVCVFSPLPRQNITIDGFKKTAVRELSRLCIHPKYQKKNLASWFISRCIKLLPNEYKCVVAYADKTFNHDGTIYKAANFSVDKIVPPDYWYIGEDGWKMHKKTLYNHAVKMNLKEAEYATKHKYHKIYGGEKIRYKYIR